MERIIIRRLAAAFTLLELLIVVGIIAILAAIAVPNFLEAQTRARVSRIKNDMRTLATAVESYAVDHNAYPYRRNVMNANLKPGVPEVSTRLQQMGALTTPIAYLSALPLDVFETHLDGSIGVIDYWDPVQTAWLINSRFTIFDPRRVKEDETPYVFASVGPDSYLGPLVLIYGWPDPPGSSLSFLGSVYINYDPTNGTNSIGNIYGGQKGVEQTAHYLTEAFGF